MDNHALEKEMAWQIKFCSTYGKLASTSAACPDWVNENFSAWLSSRLFCLLLNPCEEAPWLQVGAAAKSLMWCHVVGVFFFFFFSGCSAAALACRLFFGSSCHLAVGAVESSLELKQGNIPQCTNHHSQLCLAKTSEALRKSRADILNVSLSCQTSYLQNLHFWYLQENIGFVLKSLTFY